MTRISCCYPTRSWSPDRRRRYLRCSLKLAVARQLLHVFRCEVFPVLAHARQCFLGSIRSAPSVIGTRHAREMRCGRTVYMHVLQTPGLRTEKLSRHLERLSLKSVSSKTDTPLRMEASRSWCVLRGNARTLSLFVLDTTHRTGHAAGSRLTVCEGTSSALELSR